MRSLGLSGVRRAEGIRTTIPAKDSRRTGDLLNRDFTAPAPNRTWVMDFTYVRAWTGFVYVAFVVDVFAQRIVAWNAATSKGTDLVMAPLRMAIGQRDRDGHPIVPGELIGHADAGSQGNTRRSGSPSTSPSKVSGPRSDPSATPTTALMESVIGLYKTECIRTTVFHAGPYRTIGDVEYATAGWVDWYNNRFPRHPRLPHPGRVRTSPLRDPQPRAAPRMRAAENLGRFMLLAVSLALGTGWATNVIDWGLNAYVDYQTDKVTSILDDVTDDLIPTVTSITVAVQN
jgi:putative transposase